MDGGMGASYQIRMGIMKSFCSLFLLVSVPMFSSIVLCMASGNYTTRTLHRPQDSMLHFIDRPDLIFATTQQLSTVSNVLIPSTLPTPRCTALHAIPNASTASTTRIRKKSRHNHITTITSASSASHRSTSKVNDNKKAAQRNATPTLSFPDFPSFLCPFPPDPFETLRL